MKRLLIALLVAAVSCQSVLSYQYYPQDCYVYKNELSQINNLIIQESNYHGFNLYNERGKTVVSRVQYILNALNDKISNRYDQRSYSSSGNDVGCKQLEDEILAKSKDFGIEKIGLESNLIRLRKLLGHLDERNRFNAAILEESINKTQTCEQIKSELENANQSLDSKNAEQARKIKQQEEKIKSLEQETKRLQAKLNANAPAIHGETGKIYPEVHNPIPTVEADSPKITSTTEIAVPSASSNTSATEAEEAETSPIPDIDLRNSNGNTS